MTARLRPMTEEEFALYRERGEADYAEHIARYGDCSPEAARAKAQRDFAGLLPDGLASPGQTLLVVEEESGRSVGHLWFADRELDSGRVAYVYDIYIDDALRGRGLGREAMLLLEDVVRERGLERLALNVFGRNEVARRLYRSLGYQEVAVSMAKELTS